VRDGIDGDQPKLSDILDELGRLEHLEELKREIEKLRSGRERFLKKKIKNNKEVSGGNALKNKCHIHGHNHEWSDCPKTFRNKRSDKEDENHNCDREDNAPDDCKIKDHDDFCMECID